MRPEDFAGKSLSEALLTYLTRCNSIGTINVAAALVERDGADTIGECGFRVLREACRTGNLAMLQFLMFTGVDPCEDSEFDRKGKFPAIIRRFLKRFFSLGLKRRRFIVEKLFPDIYRERPLSFCNQSMNCRTVKHHSTTKKSSSFIGSTQKTSQEPPQPHAEEKEDSIFLETSCSEILEEIGQQTPRTMFKNNRSSTPHHNVLCPAVFEEDVLEETKPLESMPDLMSPKRLSILGQRRVRENVEVLSPGSSHSSRKKARCSILPETETTEMMSEENKESTPKRHKKAKRRVLKLRPSNLKSKLEENVEECKSTVLQKWLANPELYERPELRRSPASDEGADEEEKGEWKMEASADWNITHGDEKQEMYSNEEDLKKIELAELENIWRLTNKELRDKLVNAGIKCGTISHKTRSDYEQMLLRYEVHFKYKVEKDIKGRKYSRQLEAAMSAMEVVEKQSSERCFYEGGSSELETPKFRLSLGRKMDSAVRRKFMMSGVGSFIYLLMDPVILGTDSRKITFRSFVDSIFYVGKGCKLRPMAHMCEVKHLRDQNSPLLKKNEKWTRIDEIWSKGMGVVRMELAHGVSSDEAFTRECAVIEAIMLQNLTNLKAGNIQRRTRMFGKAQRAEFGAFILINAMRALKAEGVRQVFPQMLENIPLPTFLNRNGESSDAPKETSIKQKRGRKPKSIKLKSEEEN